MSNNQSADKSTKVEPKFNEYQAYEELRLIFAIAIETQNFSNIEARIAAWEKKYPLAEFTDSEIIRKIKTILNKDFLARLLGDYLAAKVLHEQEKQKQLYDSLKTIIDTAKKDKDYKTAQKEIRKWKDNLSSNGFSLYSFDRLYRARICTLLLLPSKELGNQEKATEELKKIKEDENRMNSDEYFLAITKWQNTYSISDFPDKLKKELNKITTDVFDSISQKRTSENAISEIQQVISSKNVALPADAISAILSKYDYKRFSPEALASIERLSMQAISLQDTILDNGFSNVDLKELHFLSPTEVTALSSLTDILNRTPYDMDRILNWIYVNRKINYSEFAREKIVNHFLSVGYKIPTQSSYAIPEINPNLQYKDTSKIDDLRKNVILNYLGIISQGNKLSLEGKDNLVEAHALSAQEVLVEENKQNPIMFLEVFDNIVEQPEEEQEKLYNEKGELDSNDNEELIYNIIIEDIIDDPLATYSIATSSKEDTTPAYANSKENSLEELSEETSTASTTYEIISEDKVLSETTTASSDTDLSYSLTIQDTENLEQAYDLSTYVVVASPILAQALEQKKERTRRKLKDIERFK